MQSLHAINILLAMGRMGNFLSGRPHRTNMGNPCLLSTSEYISSHLLSTKLKVNTYKTIILLVLLYGCETWSLIFKEKQRLRVLGNDVVRKIFRAKTDEITGELGTLHNVELTNN